MPTQGVMALLLGRSSHTGVGSNTEAAAHCAPLQGFALRDHVWTALFYH